MDRYIIHSVLLRKLNIIKLDVLNHYLGRAEKRIKTPKINASGISATKAEICNSKVINELD